MSTADVLMGRGLRVLNRVSASPLIDRFGLRKPAEQLLYLASKNAFRAAGSVGRQFAAVQKLAQPARLTKAPSRALFDLTPSDEQQMLKDAVLAFASEQLRPAAVAADAACATPAELLKASAELGVAMMGIPEALGGAGAERSAVTNALVHEAMAHGDLGLAVACLAPSAVSTALVLWGDEGQQARYLPAFTGDRLPAAALAIQEPRALFDPFALQTTAKPGKRGLTLDEINAGPYGEMADAPPDLTMRPRGAVARQAQRDFQADAARRQGLPREQLAGIGFASGRDIRMAPRPPQSDRLAAASACE